MKTSYPPVYLVTLLVLAMLGAILLCCRRQISTAQVAGGSIPLPAAKTKGEMSLEEAIAKRRSIRAFSSRTLTMEQISQLAWAAQGITDSKRMLRAAPSAGALYPLELYFVTSEGAFHYLPVRQAHRPELVEGAEDHSLAQLATADLRSPLAAAALGQNSVASAPLDVVIAAVYERTRKKYGNRAERYVHLEAGHAAQNLLLQATALGLAGVPVGAFDDEKVAAVLSLPDDQQPLYIIPIGYPPD